MNCIHNGAGWSYNLGNHTTYIYPSIGGLVGYNAGEVIKCISKIVFNGTTNISSGNVVFDTELGGFVGFNSGHISESISYGSMFASIVNYNENYGGFVGLNSVDGRIEDCYSKCDVTLFFLVLRLN